METAASFEVRNAPSSYPTEARGETPRVYSAATPDDQGDERDRSAMQALLAYHPAPRRSAVEPLERWGSRLGFLPWRMELFAPLEQPPGLVARRGASVYILSLRPSSVRPPPRALLRERGSICALMLSTFG
jgi:hypothetical protein